MKIYSRMLRWGWALIISFIVSQVVTMMACILIAIPPIFVGKIFYFSLVLAVPIFITINKHYRKDNYILRIFCVIAFFVGLGLMPILGMEVTDKYFVVVESKYQ